MKCTCPFCDFSGTILFEDHLAFVTDDSYPVSPGHLLVITKRHISSFFETSPEEKESIMYLIETSVEFLKEKFEPDGFNIGVNIGEHAGQSIPHVHIHIIPRYKGDMVNPKGGVRGVIPERQSY